MKSEEALQLAKTRFQRIGGSFQPVVSIKKDLENILKLDPAYWTLNSIDIDKLDCDMEFLLFLDSDRNGKVRVDETKEAVAWILPLFRDFSGVEKGSEELVFASLDETNPEAAAILQSAKRAMQNAGHPDAESITLSHIRDDKKLLSLGLSNGDGIVPPTQIPEESLSAFAEKIMKVAGKKTDVSGSDGIDQEIVDTFVKEGKAILAWKEELLTSRTLLLPYGSNTEAVFQAVEAIREKMDAFFSYCQGLQLLGEDPGSTPSLNPLDGEGMEAFLKNAPLQKPCREMELKLNEVINPLWEKPVRDLTDKVLKKSETCLTLQRWLTLKETLAPYADYLKRKPGTKFDSFTEDDYKELEKDLTDGKVAALTELITQDLSIDTDVQCFSRVRKLILYQKLLMDFLNNFVCLKELFNPDVFSMLQPGMLVMDGRHFTLVTRVTDIPAHKKLAARCYICVMYLEATTGPRDALKKQLLAVGVTSGDMNNLFVGKCGVFIARDAVVWDAKVVDYIQQPVSFSEALKMPFVKFGEFVGKQVDKFFSARSKDIEKEIDSTLKTAVVPAKPGAKLPPGKQTPAVSGSMMLMGGGVGLAALGSSFAFMAQALKNVSLWHVLAVFLCIILIFSGPLVILSLLKLYRRNVASFLEAGGTAINKRMRLTRKMGAIFTRTPHLPVSNVLGSIDLVSSTFSRLFGKEKMGFFTKAIILLLVTATGFLAGIFLWQFLDPVQESFFSFICKR